VSSNVQGLPQGSDESTEPGQSSQQYETLNPDGLSHSYQLPPLSPEQKRLRTRLRSLLVIALVLFVILVILVELLVFL
jgi:hypothetical protein